MAHRVGKKVSAHAIGDLAHAFPKRPAWIRLSSCQRCSSLNFFSKAGIGRRLLEIFLDKQMVEKCNDASKLRGETAMKWGNSKVIVCIVCQVALIAAFALPS